MSARHRRPPAGDLGRWLHTMLRSRGWTAAELAARMQVEPSMVSKWRRGARTPDTPHCQSLARAFGVPEHEVLLLAGRAIPLPEQVAADPIRARAHALIDVIDPQILGRFLGLMEDYHAAMERTIHERPDPGA